ncbi:MAG: NFACT RNA binding domain-containing protein [Candidatus Zixiibacteriota bacterium]
MIPKTAIATYFLACELDLLLRGSTLAKVEYDKLSKTFRFLFAGDSKQHLVFSFSPATFLCLDGWPGQGDSFAIWQELTPATVLQVEGSRGNRLIAFQCEHAQEGMSALRYSMIFELFGAQSNAFLVDEHNAIVQAARVVSDDRDLRPRSQYVAPPALADVASAGIGLVAEFGGQRYTIKYDGDKYSLQENVAASRSATPLISLLQEIQSQFHERMRFEAQLKDYKGRVRRLIGKQRQLIAQLQKQLDECNQADKFSQYGDLLMANPHTKPADGTLTVADFYTNQEVVIPLEPGKSVIETAGIYYKRAKKLQRSIKPLGERIAKAQKQIEQLNQATASLDTVTNETSLTDIIARFDLKAIASKSAADEQQSSPYYRIFESSAGEKILVGKSSEGNDVLTFKTARSWDIWFHVGQNIPGSHVILVLPDKNRAPSKASIEESARIAAYYSDMRRVTNVPVIYAERRYVRKMRKGAPGQVVYQNVKSLFVDPGLPATAREQD